MRKNTGSIHKLADMCRAAEDELRSAAGAFDKLKEAIEREGYKVIWNTVSDTYSVMKWPIK